MNLELEAIKNIGDLNRERVVFRASSKLDIGEFLLAQTGYNERGLTTKIFHSFWFPDIEVASGDLVVLYSKAGLPRAKSALGGRKTHFLYWGFEEAIWITEGRGVTLMLLADWTSKRANVYADTMMDEE